MLGLGLHMISSDDGSVTTYIWPIIAMLGQHPRKRQVGAYDDEPVDIAGLQ